MGKAIEVSKIISTADRDQGDLSTLVESIRNLGLLQPILLRPVEDDKYEVVDGRRRFEAWKALGWKILPDSAYTFAPPTGDPAVMAHVANVERKNLTPSEEVRQLAALAENHSVERLAEMFGRTPGWVARRIRIRTVKEMESELSAKRNKRALQLLLDYIVKHYTTEDWMAKIADTETLPHLMIVLGLYGCPGKYTWDSRCNLVLADCQGAEPEKVRASAYVQALGKIQIQLKAESERTLGSMSQDAGIAIALLLRIQDKWNDLRQQAMIEIPEPKSLVEARAAEKAAKAAKRKKTDGTDKTDRTDGTDKARGAR